MTKKSMKHKELTQFAELILTSDDYGNLLQRLNGTRMSLVQKARAENINLTKKKRLNTLAATLRDMIEAYK